MPEVNAVASTTAVAVTSAAPAADAAAPAGAQDGQPAGPFAAVLGQQLGRHAAADATPILKPELQLKAGQEKDATAPEDLDALIPILLGIAVPTAAATETPAAAKAQAKGDAGRGEGDGEAAALSLMSLANAQAATPTPKETSSAPAIAEQAMPAPASPSAILAASSPTEDPKAAKDGSAQQNGFDTLLASARDALPVAPAHAAAANASAPATVPTARIDAAVGAHGWDTAVGDKLVWMVGQQQSRAELVLNPPQMGRIEVSLSVSGDQANAVFASANPEVRQALEDALPRLREVLLDAGINLGQAQVGAESAGYSASGGENGDNSLRGQPAGDSPAIQSGSGAGNPWLRTGRGLVDTFA